MKSIEVTGKKVDDAIREGLKMLGTTLDRVEIKVVRPNGLFKKAIVRLTLVEDEEEKIVASAAHKSAPSIDHSEPPHKEQKREFGMKSPKQEGRAEDKNPQNSFQNKNKKPNAVREENRNNSFEKKAPENKVEHPQRNTETKREFPKQNNNRKIENKIEKKRDNNQKASSPVEERTNYETKKRARTQEITEGDVLRAAELTTELLSRMGYSSEIKSFVEDGDVVIDLVSETGALIGYRGETLDAIEYIVSILLNKDSDEYINVVVDSCGYRKKREKMLISMAENAAKKCIRQGRKVVMEPMNRSSRKIVHSTLSKYDNIFTKSEGNEPNRHIILFFKREKG